MPASKIAAPVRSRACRDPGGKLIELASRWPDDAGKG